MALQVFQLFNCVSICIFKINVFHESYMYILDPHRLEGQQEDCQNKYGCRISFQDVEFIPKVDRNIFDNLSKVSSIEATN